MPGMSFRGVEPFSTFTWNSTSNQPLQQEQTAFAAMLTGLSSSNLATAKLSQTYSDLVAGPQQDGNFPSTAVGVNAQANEALAQILSLQRRTLNRRLRSEGTTFQKLLDEVRLDVVDNGSGFDPSEVEQRPAGLGHIGLDAIRQRAAEQGGSLEVESSPGYGTAVSVAIPLPVGAAPGATLEADPSSGI